MKNTLLIAAALLVLGGTSAAVASEPLLSPRASDNQIRTVRSEARILGGRADRPVIAVSPRYADQLHSLRKAKSTGQALTDSDGPASPRVLSPRAAEQFPVATIR